MVLGILKGAVRLHSISVHRVTPFKLLLKAGFVQAHSSNPVTHEWDERCHGHLGEYCGSVAKANQ